MLYPQCVALLLAMMGMPESSIDAISLTRPVRLAGMSAGGLVEAADAVVQLSLDDMLEEQNEAQRVVERIPNRRPNRNGYAVRKRH